MILPSVIADLRDRINTARGVSDAGSFGTSLGLSLRMGILHEWLGDEGVEGGWMPPLGVLAGIAIAALRERAITHVFWIGRACWPCPLLLDAHRDLVGASFLVDPPGDRARLWAIDAALRSSARLAIIADGRGMTLAHTRRLQLAAGVGGNPCLLARPRCEERIPSAATTRWLVVPTPSTSERPRWTVAAIRNKDRPSMDHRADLEWDDAAGLVHPSSVVAGRAGHAAAIAS